MFQPYTGARGVMMKLALACLCLAAASTRGAMPQDPAPAEPTAEHRILAADVGTWDGAVKVFAGDAEPMVSKGTEVIEVMLGGLWVLSRFDGEFAGRPFQGRGQYGFDPSRKKYVGTWIDSISPTLTALEGTYDARSRTMTYVGEGLASDDKARFTRKMVTTLKGDGTRVFTLSMKLPGATEEVKAAEITYTRRK